MTKKEIREMILKKRLDLDQEKYEEYSQKIVEKLRSQIKKMDFGSIALYYPINKEVDVLPLIGELLKTQKKVYLPKVLGKQMKMGRVKSLDRLIKSKFNIPEPIDEEFSSKIDIYVIPAIAYDFKGYRIGYGGGYYDRYFLQNPKTYLIGVIFDFQLIDLVPTHCNDLQVDLIITEKKEIEIK
ncbi:MAG: 5-formyltetrahydrofolate cyclo-ligase [Petrotoga sp.]|nr:5-formyltetrahydrofolate cyclo-ligase [Petrotoga sp.]